MALDVILLLAIIVGALVLFISGVVSVDLTALLVMVSLMATGILTPEEGISGFSNTATTTVLALLILSEGLKNTGAVEMLGDRMVKLTGRREWLTLIIVMIIPAVASAFINTTAVVAVFIPVMFRIARATGIQVSVLLIPLSFSAMIGGASTMIGTSTNLLINALGQTYGMQKLRIFDLTLFGAILFGSLLLYMLTIGRHLLKKKRSPEKVEGEGTGLTNYVTEITIPENSPIINKSIDNTLFTSSDDLAVLRVIRGEGGGGSFLPINIDKLQAGDILVVRSSISQLIKLMNDPDIQVSSGLAQQANGLQDADTHLFEALIVPNSNLIDKKIKEVDFLRRYDGVPIAIRKGGSVGEQKMMDHKLNLGDIILVNGKSDQKSYWSKNDWVVVQHIAKDTIEQHLYRKDKLAVSVVILLGVIALAVTNILPILIGAWLGVVLMILTRCVTLKRVYRNVEWKVVFLLAGIIPLGIAMDKTGADVWVAQSFVALTSEASSTWVISGLFLLTVLLTGVISNQATAVLLVPIAVKIAAGLDMPAEPLVIAILFGANTSFLTPVGYQTNAMVYGPGNYRFADFLKVGGILCVLFWILATFFIPKLYM